jgi:Rrf2 family protein
MRLGKASAYGVHAALHIARAQANGPVQGRAIADACHIPQEYLLKILQRLVRGAVLRSEPGRRGGFALCKQPSATTLLELVEAIDGPIVGECPLPGTHPHVGARLRSICVEAADKTRQLLQRTTLQQLLDAN